MTMSDEHAPTSTGKSRPPRQKRTGLTSTGVRKAASKSARSRSREFALQGLYQHLVGRNEATAIDMFTRDLAGFHKSDALHYDALLHGCIKLEADLNALIAPKLDRQLGEMAGQAQVALAGQHLGPGGQHRRATREVGQLGCQRGRRRGVQV